MRSTGSTIPVDAKLMPDGNVVWLHYTGGSSPFGAEEHALNGSLVRTLDTIGSEANHHDVQPLPNGNYVLGRDVIRSGVDMSSCGGSTSHQLVDFELQEITPGGALVWSWRASDHIPFSETTPSWDSQCTTGTGDIYHWNSVQADGDGYVLSFRHLDAVYRINRATGAIDWKLGGTSRPESLVVLGDPLSAVGTFSGQHDARVLGDGSVTVHDNGTARNRPARAVRFAIDKQVRTATLLENVSNPGGAGSSCCGSARRMPGGDWIVAWGGTPDITELTGTGKGVFNLSFTDAGMFSYRANPVPPGQVSPATLRAGMNAQYPR
jgi:hypothetical protein